MTGSLPAAELNQLMGSTTIARLRQPAVAGRVQNAAYGLK
jgi:hypothetical protein